LGPFLTKKEKEKENPFYLWHNPTFFFLTKLRKFTPKFSPPQKKKKKRKEKKRKSPFIYYPALAS